MCVSSSVAQCLPLSGKPESEFTAVIFATWPCGATGGPLASVLSHPHGLDVAIAIAEVYNFAIDSAREL